MAVLLRMIEGLDIDDKGSKFGVGDVNGGLADLKDCNELQIRLTEETSSILGNDF